MTGIKRYLQRVALGLSLVAGIGTASAMPILQVENGILTGARNVDVAGTFYDVVFQDGSCRQLFSGCDAVTDFIFQDMASARLAAQALLDSVFIDGVSGLFDSDASRTRGCNDRTFCAALIPIGLSSNNPLDARGVTAINTEINATDRTDSFFIFVAENTDIANTTFAIWTRSTPVPEPTSLGLLGIAGIGWVMARRQRDRKSHINPIR